MRIYKPSVTAIRVTVSHGDQKVRFTVLESKLDELFTLILNELKEYTTRTTGQRISNGVKIHIREMSQTIRLGERTTNIYGLSINMVAERLVYAINMAEQESILERANHIIKGIV